MQDLLVQRGAYGTGRKVTVDVHRAYSFDRKVYDRAERARKASAFSIGLDLFTGVDVSAAAPLNIASIFPTAFQVLQSDLGLTYGGTPRATGTAPPVGSLTGTLATTPVPLWFKPTTPGVIGSGATFAAYADGLGTTPFQTGITPSVGVPVALTGPCAGLSHAWAAGTSNADNVWKATCSAWADQTANAKHASAASAALQPIISTGMNGKPGLLFAGAQQMTSTVGSLLTLPYLILVIAKLTAASSTNNTLVGGSSFAGTIFQGTVTDFQMYNGSAANGVASVNLTAQRFAAKFTGTTADSLRVGSATEVTGMNAGSATGATRTIGASITPSQFLQGEIFAVVYTPVVSYAAFDAAINTLAGYGLAAVAV